MNLNQFQKINLCLLVVFLSACSRDLVIPNHPAVAKLVENASAKQLSVSYIEGKWVVHGGEFSIGSFRTFATLRPNIYAEWCDLIDGRGNYCGVLIFEANQEAKECSINWRITRPVFFQFEVGDSKRTLQLGDGYGNELLRLP
jgi:hypothetical protein